MSTQTPGCIALRRPLLRRSFRAARQPHWIRTSKPVPRCQGSRKVIVVALVARNGPCILHDRPFPHDARLGWKVESFPRARDSKAASPGILSGCQLSWTLLRPVP